MMPSFTSQRHESHKEKKKSWHSFVLGLSVRHWSCSCIAWYNIMNHREVILLPVP